MVVLILTMFALRPLRISAFFALNSDEKRRAG